MTSTHEILAKCYNKSREAAVIITNGIIEYSNSAFNDIVGYDAMGRQAHDTFDAAKLKDLYKKVDAEKSLSGENVEFCGRRVDVRAFKHDGSTVVVMSDLDAISQKLRENNESFIAIKALSDKISNAITIVQGGIENLEGIRDKLSKTKKTQVDIFLSAVKEMNISGMRCMEILESMEENADKGCRHGNAGMCIAEAARMILDRFTAKGVNFKIKSATDINTFTYNHRSLSNIVLYMLEQALNDAEPESNVEFITAISADAMKLSVKYEASALPKELNDFLENPRISDMDAIIGKYGINLYLVRRIAMYYDGCMEVKHSKGIRTIKVKLPAVQIAPYVQDPGTEYETK